jgi:hypothetical protein
MLKYSGRHFVVVVVVVVVGGGGVVGVFVIMILLVVDVTLLFFLSSLRGLNTDICQAMTGRNMPSNGRDYGGEGSSKIE